MCERAMKREKKGEDEGPPNKSLQSLYMTMLSFLKKQQAVSLLTLSL